MLDLALREYPAATVLDVLMPTMDGYTALTRLPGKPAGRAEPSSRTLSTGVDAVAHPTKLFSPGQLTEMVRRVLDAAREGRRP